MKKSGRTHRIRRLARLQGLHGRDVLPSKSPELLPKPPDPRPPASGDGKGTDR